MLFSPSSFQSPLCCPCSGTRFQPQSHPEPSSGIKTARSRRKPQNSLQCLTLVLFVKVLNLPTNPCPLNSPWGSCTKGDQCRPPSRPSTCGGGTVAWVTPVFVHGATSFSPCDTAVEFDFFFCFVLLGAGAVFVRLLIVSVCSVLWALVSTFQGSVWVFHFLWSLFIRASNHSHIKSWSCGSGHSCLRFLSI